VTLSQTQVALDRDLVVLITPSDSAAPHVLLERTTTGRIAAAVTFRPAFHVERGPVDVVFLIDRSGSMQGSSIEQVRNALQLCLRSLHAGCAFDIVGFGSRFESLFDECRAYDERSLAEASRYVESLGATLGGTEILPALEFVLAHRPRKRALQLVVLTDGQVTNTDAVLDAVRRHGDRVRVFTFGIGRGASHHLVKGLARVGGGACEFVYPGERLEGKVVRLFRRAMSPALCDVHLEWAGTEAVAVPATVGPVFADEPLRAYAWIDQPVGTVTLRAIGPDGPLSWSIDLQRIEVADARLGATLTARARIRELEESGTWSPDRGSRQRERKVTRAASEIADLAIQYGLASRETSWVVVEQREVPVTEEMALRRIPVAITSEWGALDAPIRGLSLTLDQTGSFNMDAFDPIGSAAPEVLAQALRVSKSMPRASRSLIRGLVSRLRDAGAKQEDHATPASRPSSTRVLDRLVALQSADGSWNLDEALADVVGLSLSELVARIAAVRADAPEAHRAWATALALAFLEREASSSRVEWDLLATKAQRWLAGVTVAPPNGGSWLDLARSELVRT
jgi:Ca-activated chloride channel family protein